MKTEQVEAYLSRLRTEAQSMKWEEVRAPEMNFPDEAKVQVYEGRNDHLIVTVARFSIEDQGFPSGSIGCDGTALFRTDRLVLRLPRQFAEEMVALALAYLSQSDSKA